MKGDRQSLKKRDLVLFIKKIRKFYKNFEIRYYAVGEYGSRTKRPHYHIIMFNISKNDAEIILEKWHYGNVDIGEVNPSSIHYIAKYHVNRGNSPCGCEKSFAIMSKGIGSEYIEKMKSFHKGKIYNSYLPVYSFKHRMPRYYKEKLYTKVERQVMQRVTQDKVDPLDVAGFEITHPNENYFQYKLMNEIYFEQSFKQKTNENETI